MASSLGGAEEDTAESWLQKAIEYSLQSRVPDAKDVIALKEQLELMRKQTKI